MVLLFLLLCQPDGEHDLTGDVLTSPVCWCCVCTSGVLVVQWKQGK